jgi:hypothetical protein
MRHFSAAEWFDFAHNAASPGRDTSMQRHLDEGCAECRKMSAWWSEVLEIGLREPSYRPPDSAVRLAKSALLPEEGWRWLRQLAQGARIMFDSLGEPAAMEVRGSTTSSRQFLQQAKPFMIDLRLECEAAGKLVRMNGQVLSSDEPNKDVAGVEVFLLKGEHLATRAAANRFGEFDLHFQDEEGLQLFIDIPGQKVIEVQLPASLADCGGIAGNVSNTRASTRRPVDEG